MHTSVTLSIGLVLVCLFASVHGSEQRIGYFWHVTDPHVDMQYQKGANPDCNIPLCCRTTAPNQTHFAGEFGTFGRCDIPPMTLQNALNFVKSYNVDADFIIYGGDSVVHQDWYTNTSFVMEYGKLVAGMFTNTFGNDGKWSKVPIYYALGNHDVFPVDQLDPRDPAILKPLGQYWSRYLTGEILQLFQTRGYYTTLLRPGFRLLVLNTQYQDPINFWLYRESDDPGQQLAYITQVLTQAEQDHERVLISGHIPPGITDRSISPESIPAYNTKFNAIVERFSKIIVGQLYGHTHQDSFRLFRDSTWTNATSVAYITPAVTPWEIEHFAVRLFSYDLDTFDLVDMVTFYSNLTEANMSGVMTWQKEYSAREAYNMPDLSPNSWLQVWKQMDQTKEAWLKFESFYHVLNHIDCPSGDNSCKRNQICSTGYGMDYNKYHECLQARP